VLVGEHAPEIVDLPVGSRVRSGPDTARALADTSGELPPLEVKFISGGSRFEDLLMEMLRNHIDIRWGGNVDRAFRRR
jgi:trimeric autotransporter adhesin